MENTKTIYDNFANELRWFIRKKVKDNSITEDMLQDVFIKIHSPINSLKDETKLRG